jgi:hypothetical protein
MLLFRALLLPVLLAVAAPPGDSPAVEPMPTLAEAQRVDSCEQMASVTDEPGCGDQPLCSRRQRVQLACELRDAVEKRYVFFTVKSRLLAPRVGEAFDSKKHLDRCVDAERAIAREDDPLRFYDRMRRCTAAFQDGHLLLSTPARLPQVALGLSLRVVDGRVYIASRERKLVSYLKTISGLRDLEELIAVGNEVVELDGRPMAEALGAMSAFLPASSDAARLERAVDALRALGARHVEQAREQHRVLAAGERA